VPSCPLQELYLDAAALPDLRCFTSSLLTLPAALPGTGPGACTGLYLVDQILPGPDHMAALGQLRALKVGRVRERPVGGEMHWTLEEWVVAGYTSSWKVCQVVWMEKQSRSNTS
jgi:hypothetical protein